jgi:MFS transporter, SP family, sugar:H+ symporter
MLFYAPELFSTLGSGTNEALVSALVVNSVLLSGALTSFFVVDRVGRRPLLVVGALCMFIFQVAVAGLLGAEFDPFNPEDLDTSVAASVLAMVCLFTYAFGTTWGPLGWLVPVEIQSHSTRSAGSTASVAVNFFAVFLTTQLFLSMLCSMQWGIFLFFAAFDAIGGVFSWWLVPETMSVPIEEMRGVWKAHWFWGKWISNEKCEDLEQPVGTDSKDHQQPPEEGPKTTLPTGQ